MADAGVNTEAGSAVSSRWEFLKNLFKKQAVRVSPETPVNLKQEITSIPANSGLQELIETFGEEGSTDRAAVEYPFAELYPDVMVFIDHGGLGIGGQELQEKIKRF